MPLKSGSDTDRAYAAGLIDGEGSISASPSPRCQHNYRVQVAVAMCDYEPLGWLMETFGSKVRIERRVTKTGKPIFTWSLYCQNAADFLEMLLPYLKIKRGRAIDATALARLSKSRTKAKAHVFTVDELATRRALADQIRTANIESNGRFARYAA